MIELSADLGEAATDRDREIELAMWPMIDAANVACGGHAGDDASMLDAVLTASRLGVILGAHPSYPDRENFGRETMVMEPDALRGALIAQIESLRAIGVREGVRLQRVKPHGALYNDAYHDRKLAEVIVEAMRRVDPRLALVAGNRSEMAKAARAKNTLVIREAFADRRYRADGSLVPRNEPDALLTVPESADQVEVLVLERRIAFDTICIHADMEGALKRLKAIHERLARIQVPRSRI